MIRNYRSLSLSPQLRSVLFAALLCLGILLPALPLQPLAASPGIDQPEQAQAQDTADPLIAFLRQGNLWQMNADGSDPHQITDYPEGVTQYSWSPSGRYILLQHGGRFWHYTMWRNGDPPEARLTIYDVTTGKLRDLVVASVDGQFPKGRFPSWAQNADELLMEVAGPYGSGPYSIVRVGLDGATTPVASYSLPPTCGGPDGPMTITRDLLWEQEFGSPFARDAYRGIVWWADRDIAYVNTECGQGISLDLSTSQMTEYPSTVWLAAGPNGRIVIQDSALVGGLSAGVFDPVTGTTMPIEVGEVYGWTPAGEIAFTSITEGPESAFTSVFDDLPTRYTDNTVEVWRADGQGGNRQQITVLDAYGTGVPSVGRDGMIIVGVVDNPSALMDVDTSQYGEYSPEVYAEHQKVLRIDATTGEIATLATNVYRPRLQPAGAVTPDAPTPTEAVTDLSGTPEVPVATAPTGELPAASANDGWIAYSGNDGNIWLSQSDGSGQRQVTTDGSPDRPYIDPSWSHDGTMLVFSTRNPEDESGNDIYLLKDGAVTRIPSIYNCDDAAFTPDNARLVLLCASVKDGGSVPDQQWLDRFAPDGFVSIVDLDGSNWEVLAPFQMQVDGSNTLWWTMLQTYDISVSPIDGELLVNSIFWSSARWRQIHLIDSEGSWDARFEAPPDEQGRIWGAFAPDGTNILARLCRGCYKDSPGPPNTSILLVDREGNIIETLYTPDSNVMIGTFSQSPDGTRLLIRTTIEETDFDLGSAGLDYVTQMVDIASGTVTEIPINGGDFAWQPVAAEVALPESTAGLRPTTPFISTAPVIAINCTTTSEGFFVSPGGQLDMPEGCSWAEGMTLEVTGPTDESYGSCTIGSAGYCDTLGVWMPTDVQVTVTVDETTIPEGYVVVDGNPKTFTYPSDKINTDAVQWLWVNMPADVAEGQSPPPIEDTSEPETAAEQPTTPFVSPPIVAISCTAYAEDFYSSEGIGLDLPDDCSFAVSAVFSVTGPNGEDYGTCTTNENGFCGGGIWMPTDVKVTITQDEATIPEGYVLVDGNPRNVTYPSGAMNTDAVMWLFVTMPANVDGGQPSADTGETPAKNPSQSTAGLQLESGSDWVAYVGEDGNIWLMRPDGSNQTRVTTDGTVENGLPTYDSPSWSHDGMMLTFLEYPYSVGTGGVWLLRDGTLSLLPNTSQCFGPAFSADSQRVLYTCQQSIAPGDPVPPDLATNPLLGFVSSSALDGSDQRIEVPYTTDGVGVPWTSDGKAFHYGGRIDVRPSDGVFMVVYHGHRKAGVYLFSLDGSMINRFDLSGPDGVDLGPYDARFTPDGEHIIATVCTSGCFPGQGNDPVHDIVTVDLGGAIVREWTLAYPGQYSDGVDISPDGLTIVSGHWYTSSSNGEIVIRKGPEQRTVIGLGTNPAWQPNPDVAMQQSALTGESRAIQPSGNAPAEPSDGGTASVPDAYLGTWDGRGTQANPVVDWPVTIVLIGGGEGAIVGTAEYPEQACGGDLILQEVTTDAVVLTEDLTYGEDACTDGGTITLGLQSDDTVSFDWVGLRSDGSSSSAAGSLDRRGSGTSAQPSQTNTSTVPDAFLAAWSGIGVQINPSVEWPVTITITGGSAGTVVGVSDYPEQSCGGDLVLQDATADAIVLVEQLTYGQGSCTDGGTITLSGIDVVAVQFEWIGTRTDGSASSATGTLFRPDSAALPGDSVQQVPFTGYWGGTGYRNQPAVDWPIFILINNGAEGEELGHAEYPSYDCIGVLTLTAVNGDGSITLREDITIGEGTCVDGGAFTLRQVDSAGDIEFRWTGSDGATTAEGVLVAVNHNGMPLNPTANEETSRSEVPATDQPAETESQGGGGPPSIYDDPADEEPVPVDPEGSGG